MGVALFISPEYTTICQIQRPVYRPTTHQPLIQSTKSTAVPVPFCLQGPRRLIIRLIGREEFLFQGQE